MKCDDCGGTGRVLKYLDTSNETIETEHRNKLPRNYNEKGRCFISTACVTAEGLPDNCQQLQILRNFRDNHVKKQAGGLEDISEYYLTAPKVIQAVNLDENSLRVYSQIYERWIKKAVSLIQRGDLKQAYGHYKEMMDSLKKRFLISD